MGNGRLLDGVRKRRKLSHHNDHPARVHKTASMKLYFFDDGNLDTDELTDPEVRIKDIDPDASVERLPEFFCEVARQLISTHPAGKLARQLRETNSTLTLTSSIFVPHCSWDDIPLDRDCRIEKVSDLFEDPADYTQVLYAEVALSQRPSLRRVTLDSLVHLPSPSNQLHCIRVGNFPILDEQICDRDLQDTRLGPREDGVAYFWPLLVQFDSSLMEVRLKRVHAYEFDDFCIGDPAEDGKWHQVKFDHRHHFLGPFLQVRWKSEKKTEFVSRLYDHMAEGADPVATGMPFLPTLCFERFKCEKYGLGLAEWPKYGVDLAVRCLIPESRRDELPDVSFPRDIRLVVMQEDGMDDLRGFIADEINVKETQDGREVDSGRLFEPRYKDTWKFELWVMPQRQRRLFRYKGGSITQFLDKSDRTRTRDKKLYMEAFIIPTDKQEEGSRPSKT